jgi:mono/diheme cytochrome c family protein
VTPWKDFPRRGVPPWWAMAPHDLSLRLLMKVWRYVAGIGLASLVSGGALAQGGERSVMSGVFTVEQVAKGRAGHRVFCLECHGTEAYTGEPFETMWLGRTVFDFFDALRTTMPNDEPGKLTTEEYVDVIAYILNLNGYPPGAQALSYDENELRRVRIDSLPPRAATDTSARARGPHRRQR